MAIDWPWDQKGTTAWTLLTALLIGGFTYFLGQKQITYGLGFGVLLAIVNYRVIGTILKLSLHFTSPKTGKVISFLSYYVRFLLVVAVLYIVIPKTGYFFTVGIFIGFFIPKVVMGVFLVKHADDEWWNGGK